MCAQVCRYRTAVSHLGSVAGLASGVVVEPPSNGSALRGYRRVVLLPVGYVMWLIGHDSSLVV